MKNNKRSNGSKHIQIKYLLVRGEVKEQQIKVEHINFDAMIVDQLTKGLLLIIFSEHCCQNGSYKLFHCIWLVRFFPFSICVHEL